MLGPCLARAAAGAAVCLAASGVLAQPTVQAQAREASGWELVAAPYTHHFHGGDDHHYVYLLGLERYQRDGPLWGAAAFRNTFGQPSGYLYYGHVWEDLFSRSGWYFKLTGGLLYGYKGKYKNRVPFNHGGFSPAVVPGLGYRLTGRDAVQVMMLGTSGLMFSYNHRF